MHKICFLADNDSWVKAMSRHICFWNCKRSLVANCRRPAGCFRFRFRLGWWVQFAVPLLTAHWHMLSQVPSHIPHPASLGCQFEPSCHRHWPRPDPPAGWSPFPWPVRAQPSGDQVRLTFHQPTTRIEAIWSFYPTQYGNFGAQAINSNMTHYGSTHSLHTCTEKKWWLKKFACLG